MKYNGFYFWMFKSPMKQVLAEKYGKKYATNIMKKSKKVYRELVEKADDIGDDNPMAYNELFALAFVAPYVASEKKIPPETVQEMMRRSLYHIKWYFAKTDLNTDKGKAENKKWCCTIKVDIGNSKSQYIEKDKQEATKDGSESTEIQHGI